MSFKYDIEKIMMTKNNIRTSPSIRLNATHEYGFTSQMYAFVVSHQAALSAITGASAQPSAIKAMFVNSRGATMNNSTLNPRAKIIEPTALADWPAFFAAELSGITTFTGAFVKFSSVVPSARTV